MKNAGIQQTPLQEIAGPDLCDLSGANIEVVSPFQDVTNPIYKSIESRF